MNTDITASAKPEYPVIDRNPAFTKVVGNFNTLDYCRFITLTGVSVTVGYLSGIKPGIKGPSMVTGGLIGIMGGFMYAYQNSAGRLMGFFPNEDSVLHLLDKSFFLCSLLCVIPSDFIGGKEGLHPRRTETSHLDGLEKMGFGMPIRICCLIFMSWYQDTKPDGVVLIAQLRLKMLSGRLFLRSSTKILMFPSLFWKVLYVCGRVSDMFFLDLHLSIIPKITDILVDNGLAMSWIVLLSFRHWRARSRFDFVHCFCLAPLAASSYTTEMTF
ncbi:hypothetical protein DKX38_023384 [Salix brachista]|uniref:NADH-ubiquinone oxidoreductase 21kDa subunit N-terminal domain-containing protein n=1 Tax=Salix brachista TaxID=2182728 RepID=A0A5N5JPM9_9ROSI|nr:hypothetical protein DKX38_023384 [Salix brachista]